MRGVRSVTQATEVATLAADAGRDARKQGERRCKEGKDEQNCLDALHQWLAYHNS